MEGCPLKKPEPSTEQKPVKLENQNKYAPTDRVKPSIGKKTVGTAGKKVSPSFNSVRATLH